MDNRPRSCDVPRPRSSRLLDKARSRGRDPTSKPLTWTELLMRPQIAIRASEPGKQPVNALHAEDLHSRLSRDNGMWSSDEEDKQDTFELMQQGVSRQGDGLLHSRLRRSRTTKWSDLSSWIFPISVLFVCLLLVFVFLTSLKKLYSPSPLSNIRHDSPDEPLGIVLHPTSHIHRTPKTIVQSWNITSESRSPDGVEKQVYLINGQFPGPLIECRSGDHLIIHVTNGLSSLREEGISIHWHGLSMRSANAMDGASSFTQCGILPGKSFTYDFVIDADQSGTFWYHAHSAVQRGDGMYGGLVVHKPVLYKATDVENSGYKEEVLLLIGDWYHRNATEVLTWYMSVRAFRNEACPLDP